MGVSHGEAEVAGMPGRARPGVEGLLWTVLPLKRVPGFRISVGLPVMAKPVSKASVPGRAQCRMGLDVCVTAALQVRQARCFSSKGALPSPCLRGEEARHQFQALGKGRSGQGLDFSQVL